jgi:hypothetical protein
MSKFVIVDQILGNPTPVSQTATVQQFPFGPVVNATDAATVASSLNMGGGQFVYAQGSNVTAIGQFVHLSGVSAVLLASANSASFFPIGVAAGNLSASNVFGWVQVNGMCDYARGTNSSIPAGAALYLAGTAGLLISNSAAGSRVIGVVCSNSYTSSQSASLTVQLFNAHMLGVTAGL